jgi:hypothetical protein
MSSSAPAHSVFVTNISAQATEKTLTDFFSFCGDLESAIQLTPDPANEGTQKGVVTFKDDGAVQTALLLTNAMIVDRPIHVTSASGEGEGAAVEPTEDQVREGEPSKTSVLAKMFAAGFVLGDDARAKARAYDEKHSVLLKLKVAKELAKLKLNELDQKLHVSETAGKVSAAAKSQYAALDEQHHISDKANAAKAAVVGTAGAIGAAAMQNPVVAGGVGLLEQAAAVIKEQVHSLKQDTARAVEEKRAGRPSNPGANPYPQPASAANPEVAGNNQ